MIKRVDPSHHDRPVPGEGRLRRWSRLKQEARDEQDKPSAVAEAEKSAALTPAGATPDAAGSGKDDPTKDLPPIESLDKDSDYSLFMREGVPDDRRAEALQKLWASDSAFREAFPFEMHMEDYNATFRPIDALKDTIYKVGRGFLTPEEVAAQSGEVAEKKKEASSGAEKTGEQQAGAIAEGDTSGATALQAESSADNLGSPDGKEGHLPDALKAAVDKPDKST